MPVMIDLSTKYVERTCVEFEESLTIDAYHDFLVDWVAKGWFVEGVSWRLEGKTLRIRSVVLLNGVARLGS